MSHFLSTFDFNHLILTKMIESSSEGFYFFNVLIMIQWSLYKMELCNSEGLKRPLFKEDYASKVMIVDW